MGPFFCASMSNLYKGFLVIKLFLKFLLPSIIGVLLFLFPVSSGENSTILLAVITSIIREPFEPYILEIIVSVVILSALGSGYYQIAKPSWRKTQPSLFVICHSSPLWFFMRLTGAIFAVMVYFKIGPEIVWAKETGLTVFTEIGATIFFIVTVACFLMPFLTEFGFMEFIGTMLSRPFGVLFTLPGRSAIDAMASFLTSSNVGLLITIGQYEKGYYSAREAAAIAVNFSVVSVSFSLLIASVAGIDHMFFNWYLSVVAACVACAIITVRIPPLSNIANTYFKVAPEPPAASTHQNIIMKATEGAMLRAETAASPLKMIVNSWHGALGIVFGVLAPSMAVGTMTIILLTHTPVFDILSYPIYAIFDLINFPEAKNAAPGVVIGFLDQFMPALVASNIENDLVKFVLAGLAVTQLIYMSEVGLIILRSSLPLKFSHLCMIFIMRTVISFPILLIAGLWLL